MEHIRKQRLQEVVSSAVRQMTQGQLNELYINILLLEKCRGILEQEDVDMKEREALEVEIKRLNRRNDICVGYHKPEIKQVVTDCFTKTEVYKGVKQDVIKLLGKQG